MNTFRFVLGAGLMAGLLLASPASFAQRGSGAGAQSRGSAASGTRLLDRDRLSTRSMDRLHDQTRDRLHDRTQDRLHDQDRLRQQDRDRIYGADLMTARERQQYEQKLHSLATEQERVQFRMEHEQQMQQRAHERGITLRQGPSERQVRTEEQQRQREREQTYGYSLMTPAEVAQYRERLRSAHTEQQREKIRSEHHEQMQQRARERGEAPPK